MTVPVFRDAGRLTGVAAKRDRLLFFGRSRGQRPLRNTSRCSRGNERYRVTLFGRGVRKRGSGSMTARSGPGARVCFIAVYISSSSCPNRDFGNVFCFFAIGTATRDWYLTRSTQYESPYIIPCQEHTTPRGVPAAITIIIILIITIIIIIIGRYLFTWAKIKIINDD